MDLDEVIPRLWVQVNNASIQHVSPLETFPPEKWDLITALNLSSCFHLIRHTLPGMRERGYGRIINIASVHGLVASAHKSAYVAAKHGLVGLTKAVALETAGSQGVLERVTLDRAEGCARLASI